MLNVACKFCSAYKFYLYHSSIIRLTFVAYIQTSYSGLVTGLRSYAELMRQDSIYKGVSGLLGTIKLYAV